MITALSRIWHVSLWEHVGVQWSRNESAPIGDTITIGEMVELYSKCTAFSGMKKEGLCEYRLPTAVL